MLSPKKANIMQVKCSNCGKKFGRIPSALKQSQRPYCSLKCAYYDRDHHIKNKDFFEQINAEEKAYWLGFIYADGNLSSSMNRVKIEIASRDRLHLKKFCKLFNAPIVEFEHKGFVRGNSNAGPFFTSRCSICSRTLWNSLNDIGVEPRKSKKDLVKVFDHVPHELMHHFIRGEFDGDGSICFNKNTAMFSFNGGNKFLTAIKSKMLDCMPLNDVRVVPSGSIHKLQWTGLPQLKLIREWLYANATLYLTRKKDVFDSIERRLGRQVSSKFRGVSWITRRSKWQSMIKVNKKAHYLGYYDDELEAALAYNTAVVAHGLPRYRLNEIKDTSLPRLGEQT